MVKLFAARDLLVTAAYFGSATAFLTPPPLSSRPSHTCSICREHVGNWYDRGFQGRVRVSSTGTATAAAIASATPAIGANRVSGRPAGPLKMVQGVDAEEKQQSLPKSGGTVEDAESKAAKLRAFAAELRAQAEVLESQRASERKQAAQKAFDAFDTNDDGTVDVKELIAGLEGQLRKDFVRRMTKKMQRKPTPDEIAEKIAEMPGGVLLPVDLGTKLIEMYDTNGDGVLQRDEFAPKEDLKLKLDSLFSERAQEARLKEAEERVKEIEERGAIKAREAAKKMGLALPEDFNNAPPSQGDKILSALPYVLPLMDSLVYGTHIFTTYPEQLKIFEPLVAVLLIYRSLPLSGLILFFGLQYFANKPEINKLVRFNCRQAVNIDIAMFFPSFLAWGIQLTLGDKAAALAPLAIAGSDVIFVTVIVAVLYSIVSSAFGILPENLPLVGPANRDGAAFRLEDKKGKDDGEDKKP